MSITHLIATDNGYGYARHTDPTTSHDAANSVHFTDRELDVLDALDRIGEGCAWDICRAIEGVRGTFEVPSNITPRLGKLVDRGAVVVTKSEKAPPYGKRCQFYKRVC